MRKLNREQKRLLVEWFNANKDGLGVGFQMDQCEAFPYDLYVRLQKINDFETIVQHINRFVGDLAVEVMYQRP